jgi:uncharacterized protein (TIGR00369 family)
MTDNAAPHMDFSVHIPFVEHLGFELLRIDGGEAEIRFAPRPEHLNSFSVVHGGASMTLLDVVMAHAARSILAEAEADMGCVTTTERGTVVCARLANAKALMLTV